jgi:hypothetical protein
MPGKSTTSHPTRPASRRERKRGAQPGNANAVQHGFYSRALPPTEWELHSSSAIDTLEWEIKALRVLINRLAAVQDQPDPEMKDPDAPFTTILSASHRLDTLLRIQNTLHSYELTQEAARWQREILQDINKKSTPLTELLTVNNLDKIRLKLGGPQTYSLKEILKDETMQEYASLFEDPEPEEDLWGMDASITASKRKANEP